MSEKIVDIEERMPHKTGSALCSTCGKTWIFTAPVKTMILECPSCGKMTGGEIKSHYAMGFWDGAASNGITTYHLIRKHRWFLGKKKLLKKIAEKNAHNMTRANLERVKEIYDK